MDKRWHFFSADIELSSYCGTGCRFCPREAVTRPQGTMTQTTFQAITDKLAPLKSRLTCCGMGNPLLNPSWTEFITTYRDTGGTCGLVLHVSELTLAVIEQLVQTRPSHLEVSFPSVNPEVFEKLCPGTSFDDAQKRCRALIDHPDRRFPITMTGIQTKQNPDEADHYTAYWRLSPVATRIYTIHSRGGHLHDTELLTYPEVSDPHHPCGLFAIHAFIAWNGDILACCHDLKGDAVIGNIITDSLDTLMDRKADVLQNVPHIDGCTVCDDSYRNTPIPDSPFPDTPAKRRAFLKSLGRKAAQT